VGGTEPSSTVGEPEAASTEIFEAWESPRTPLDNVDSLAFWQQGGQAWVIATGKESHRLNVYNATDGTFLHHIGEPGEGPGQLQRPNGIAVVDDVVIVCERDNHRLHFFSLPWGQPLGVVGEDVLRYPYGLTVIPTGEGQYEIYVTDNYQTSAGEVPPAEELGERVKHFRVEIGEETVEGTLVRSFGATEGEGVLTFVETILADAPLDRLLVTDETAKHHKVYDLEGTYQGRLLGAGHFRDDPEGIALFACDDGSGTWVTTDQGPARSTFRLFDRQTLEPLGAFHGPLTANTDGVVLTQEAFPGFDHGAFFAVHDDQSVTAFSWAEIAAAFDLPVACAEGGP
jgi:3-phytase